MSDTAAPAHDVQPPAAEFAGAMVCLLPRLRAFGYTEAECCRRLGLGNLGEFGIGKARPERAVAAQSCEDAAGVLIRLFLFEDAVSRRLLSQSLGVEITGGLIDAGLLEDRGDSCAPLLSLVPLQELYLTSDRRPLNPRINQVMWLYPESHQLASLLLHRRGKRVLDLCTGSGVHALVAAHRGASSLGVDISTRAVAFAAFNRAINRCTGSRFAVGDLYEPAAAAAPFDLVVANPPYNPVVSSPAGANCYSGGESGEEILGRIVGGLPQYLSENGYCQIVTLIIHRAGEDLEAKLRSWLGPDGRSFDILVLCEPIDYLRGLPAELLRHGLMDPHECAESWRRQRITGFEFGTLHLRRARQRDGSFVCKSHRATDGHSITELFDRLVHSA
jgi:methylase of polypeptide subunit release factors